MSEPYARYKKKAQMERFRLIRTMQGKEPMAETGVRVPYGWTVHNPEYYSQNFPGLTGRSAEVAGDDYVIIPVNTRVRGSGKGVAFISKETGLPSRQAALGGKEEIFRIDLIAGRLFHLDGSKQLTCYKF